MQSWMDGYAWGTREVASFFLELVDAHEARTQAHVSEFRLSLMTECLRRYPNFVEWDPASPPGIAVHVTERWDRGRLVGQHEFAGCLVVRLDSAMRGLPYSEQGHLYDLRQALFAHIDVRSPDFDLEREAKRHA